MRVLHLPTSIAGNPVGLCMAERNIGVDSHCLDIFPDNKYGYKADLMPRLDFLSKFGIPGKALSLFATFIKLRDEFDIFHFNDGHTLLDYYPLNLNYLDLPYYPKGKKLIMTFNGSDARQKRGKNLFTSLHNWDEEISYNHLYNDDILNSKKRKRIEIVNRYADQIFSVNPDLFKFLPARTKFLPYTIASWDAIDLQNTKKPITKITIVHAPSNRAVKGTDYIVAALDSLQLKYKNIEVIYVENISNKKALEIYKSADLLIDQLLIGWYGGVAVEFMKMGKPVMTFIRKSDLKYIPKEMAQDCTDTFINVNPTNIYDKLCTIAENPTMLKAYSKASLGYVHRWHNPATIAKYVSGFY